MEWQNVGEEGLNTVAAEIIRELKDKTVVLLKGDLGAGKTRLVKQLVGLLGSEDVVSSPTFSIVNIYQSGETPIYHMDMYRLKNIDEALDIGLLEYLNSGDLCFIEWPEVVMDLIDPDYLLIDIQIISPDKRTITI